MVRVFKVDAEIRNAFPTCICGAALVQTRRLTCTSCERIGVLLVWTLYHIPGNFGGH